MDIIQLKNKQLKLNIIKIDFVKKREKKNNIKKLKKGKNNTKKYIRKFYQNLRININNLLKKINKIMI